ncbi:hypothetical protein RR48_12295 [Papilio machaon]|uniref:Uncharacterized protein n=1 Tax=Papilio machaon TaxID=76193 RepID=A0A194QST7_PAPMA|nr:hypothetical protein RR48_12295 [Papilio machaon]
MPPPDPVQCVSHDGKIASISCVYKNIISVEQTGLPPTYPDNAASAEKLIWHTVTGSMPITW